MIYYVIELIGDRKCATQMQVITLAVNLPRDEFTGLPNSPSKLEILPELS